MRLEKKYYNYWNIATNACINAFLKKDGLEMPNNIIDKKTGQPMNFVDIADGLYIRAEAIYMAEKRGGKKCHVSNQRITECIGSDLAPAFIAHYEKPPLDIKMVENGRYTSNYFKNIDDKLFALSSLVSEDSLDEMIVEDFIVNCLGDEYWVIYSEMRKQRDTVLSGKTSSKGPKNR